MKREALPGGALVAAAVCAAAFCCLADGIELDLGQLPRDKEIPNYDYPVRAAEPIISGMESSVWRSMEV